MTGFMGRAPKVCFAAAVVALTMLASGCGSSSSGGSSDYTIGFPAIESGPAAFAGVPITQGAQLAVKQANAEGFLGKGSHITLKIDDDKADPAQAIALYKQYVADGVSGVLCCGLGAESGALLPLAKGSHVPAIVTSAIMPGLNSPPDMFRPVILPNDKGGMYDQFVDAAVPKLGIKTAVIVQTADEDVMVSDAKTWAAALERNGVKVLKVVDTAAADTNFIGAATQIAGVNPDAVVMSTLGTPSALIAKTLRERGYTKPLLTQYGVDSDTLFKTSAGGLAGAIFVTTFHAGFTNNDLAKKFTTDFRAEFNKDPDVFAAQGYTSAWLLMQGIKDAKSKDSKKVGAALAKITDVDTVYGPVTYTDGQASLNGSPTFLEWTEDGKVEAFSGS